MTLRSSLPQEVNGDEVVSHDFDDLAKVTSLLHRCVCLRARRISRSSHSAPFSPLLPFVAG
jgi:hypothetical protein